MTIAFTELLKDVENAAKKGFKEGTGWKPHKSAEGGTRTLAYGHKLSDSEEKGNFVELPNGEIIEFSDRGLTEEEADMLLNSDVARARRIAAKQWDGSQDGEFSSLSPVHQNVLSEIVFNIGSLNNKSGKFGWPSLAKGIENDDIEVIKKELSRSYTTPKGVKKELTRRVNKIRDYVDSPDLDAVYSTPDVPTPSSPSFDPIGFMENLDLLMEARRNGPSSASKTPSEGNTEPKEGAVEEEESAEDFDYQQAAIDQIREALKGRTERGEKKLKRTANEAKLSEKADSGEEKSLSDMLRSSPKAMEVLREKHYNRPVKKSQRNEDPARREDDSKDPTYGIF